MTRQVYRSKETPTKDLKIEQGNLYGIKTNKHIEQKTTTLEP